MTEITFLVEADANGGYTAKATDAAIFTQAESLHELREAIKEAVVCHLDHVKAVPGTIKLMTGNAEVVAEMQVDRVDKMRMMRQAATDAGYLADLNEVNDDFSQIDGEAI